MKTRNILTSPPQLRSARFTYGFLVFMVLLLLWNVKLWWSVPPSYPYDRYTNLVVVLMLLLNHLAFQFRWPRWGMIVMRLLALGWCVFGLFYVLYWSPILYPLKQASP
ncbi:MAG: hypothetical protein NTY98_05955 [Verrucomicrobia bacterium]|nr:hypothetical protein [Verrucomicrobiota bacterium]